MYTAEKIAVSLTLIAKGSRGHQLSEPVFVALLCRSDTRVQISYKKSPRIDRSVYNNIRETRRAPWGRRRTQSNAFAIKQELRKTKIKDGVASCEIVTDRVPKKSSCYINVSKQTYLQGGYLLYRLRSTPHAALICMALLVQLLVEETEDLVNATLAAMRADIANTPAWSGAPTPSDDFLLMFLRAEVFSPTLAANRYRKFWKVRARL